MKLVKRSRRRIERMGKNLANFEGLIRGALSAKGETTPETRSQVYQSSRNALQRLIEGNRSLTVEAAVRQQQSLEEAIARIEQEYARPVTQPPVETSPPVLTDTLEDNRPSSDDLVSNPPPPPKPVQSSDPFFELQQVLGTNLSASSHADIQEKPVPDETSEQEHVGTSENVQSVNMEPDVVSIDGDEASIASGEAIENPEEVHHQDQVDTVYLDDERQSIPPAFAKRRRMQKTLFWVFLSFVVLFLVVWLAYRVLIGVLDGSLLGYGTNNGASLGETSIQRDAESEYINVVEPGDLTAMVVSDRGRIEIINEQSLEMIRLLSIRDDVDRSQSAKPILLRLKPGVIQQVRGKRVTVEIFARSGSSAPAQFAVECIFDNQIGCGRKRFRVGVQPEASVFAFTMGANTDINADAFIAISTDITDDAAITGEGDVLDIGYVRLRTAKD